MEIPGSLRKVLELYERLGVEELDVETAARQLGLKKSTVKKYMDQLAKMGLLVKKYTNVYALPAREKAGEEKPIEEAKEAGGEREAGETGEAVAGREVTAEPSVEEIKSEALQVKPGAEVIETFYFYFKGSVVPLRITSLEQLAAVLKYKLIAPEELAYTVRTGFLQTWLERALHETELAKKLDELRGLSDQELFNEVSKIVFERTRLC